MDVIINGDPHSFRGPLTVHDLLSRLDLDPRKIAVERNLEIVPRSTYAERLVEEGDSLEIVQFIGGGAPEAPALVSTDCGGEADGPLVVSGRRLSSRLILGTGKYRDFEETAAAIEASGANMVTVAVRRVNISDPNAPMLMDYVDPKKYTYLPNTAGCFTAQDAVRTLRLAREAGGWSLVKLEVLGEEKTLYPNMVETLEAAEALIADGFQVMVYCSDDPIMAKRLEALGCVAIMPLAAPIGFGAGHPESGQHPSHYRAILGAGHRRCRGRNRVGRGDRDGVGLRRRADEHGDRPRQGPGDHGARDEGGGRGRASRLPRGADGEKTLCRSVVAAGRPDLGRRAQFKSSAARLTSCRRSQPGEPSGRVCSARWVWNSTSALLPRSNASSASAREDCPNSPARP